MSGLTASFGKPDPDDVRSMMKVIAHRGPYASGTYQSGQVIMAQNYLEADGAIVREDIQIPIRSSTDPSVVICYDGQIGNWPELARIHQIPDGPFREERLLHALYAQFGREMLGHLGDAIYALVIFDGKNLMAARDVLGIKTLFYGWKDGTLHLASELKSLQQVTPEVHEFPNGHRMDGSGRVQRFSELPTVPPVPWTHSVDRMANDIREIVERSFNSRIDYALPTGGLLSGGMDSSVINYIASKAYKKRFGQQARMSTFALGVGESDDILAARIMATHIDSKHHELIIETSQILDALPQVIYHLESFDPSLVRSAVSNYLISQYARKQGIEILLSGEGGDEVFCGYSYLASCPPEELFAKQEECLGFLHNNASLRLDRMNMCHSVRVVAPLISGELLTYALAIPPEYKQRPEGNQKIEKWIFRKAYEGPLPQAIVWRPKQEFSQGSGSASVLPQHFEQRITDHQLAEAQARYPLLRSKEELYYFQLFTQFFGDGHAVRTVGQWICL